MINHIWNHFLFRGPHLTLVGSEVLQSAAAGLQRGVLLTGAQQGQVRLDGLGVVEQTHALRVVFVHRWKAKGILSSCMITVRNALMYALTRFGTQSEWGSYNRPS